MNAFVDVAGRSSAGKPSGAAQLFAAVSDDQDGRTWTYMGYGPFATLPEFRTWMKATCLGDDPLFHAVVDTATGQAVGVASYLRIDPKFGVIETGHIHYSPRLQRTRAATRRGTTTASRSGRRRKHARCSTWDPQLARVRRRFPPRDRR